VVQQLIEWFESNYTTSLDLVSKLARKERRIDMYLLDVRNAAKWPIQE
jgi:hypothetical protein